MDANTSYETPKVVDHGDLVELTAATTSGSILDGSTKVPLVLSGPPTHDVTPR